MEYLERRATPGAQLQPDVGWQRRVRDGPVDVGAGVREPAVAAQQVDVLDLQRRVLPAGGLLLRLADRRVGAGAPFQEEDQLAGGKRGRA